MTSEPIAIRDGADRLYAFARVFKPRPACIGCVLEARALVPPALTQVEAGQRLYQRMGELDLSMHDLARRGLALTQICKWVNGVQNPSPEARPRLAAALEMSQLELEAMLPRPGRRSREPGADWRCSRHCVPEPESE
jgi:hypothetical protein